MVLPEGRTTRRTWWWVWGSFAMMSASGGVIGMPRRALERSCPKCPGGSGHPGGYPSSMPNIGPLELVILLVIVLLIFGPKRLPGLGRQLGSGMREFKDSVTGKADDDDRPALPKAAETHRAPVD